MKELEPDFRCRERNAIQLEVSTLDHFAVAHWNVRVDPRIQAAIA
jgi:hypothetical protein